MSKNKSLANQFEAVSPSEKPRESHSEELNNNDTSTHENSKSLQDVSQDIMDTFTEMSKRKTVEDTHTRATYLVRNDLLKRLDKLAKGKRGFKTLFVNKAMEALLNDLENEK